MTRCTISTAGSSHSSAETMTSWRIPRNRVNETRFSSSSSSRPHTGLRIETKAACGPDRPAPKGRPFLRKRHVRKACTVVAIVPARAIQLKMRVVSMASPRHRQRRSRWPFQSSYGKAAPSLERAQNFPLALPARKERLPRVQMLLAMEIAVADVRKLRARNRREKIPATGHLPQVDQISQLFAPVPQIEGVGEPVRLL